MERSSRDYFEFYRDDLEPDRSKTDYYCKVCEAHMNSEEMWESHISGKRHLKNIQKYPGGLEYMTELQRFESYLKPSYTCHLCHANCTWSVVIDHILTTKHRMAYIKAVDPNQYEIIEGMALSSRLLDKLAEDQAREYEAKLGCGNIEVKLEKPKLAPPPPKQEMSLVPSERSPPFSPQRAIRSASCNRSRSRSPCSRQSDCSPPHKPRSYCRSSSSEDESRCSSGSLASGSEMDAHISISDKSKLIRELCENLDYGISESLAEEIPGIVLNLMVSVMKYHIRQLPLVTQNKLAKYIARREKKKLEEIVIPFINEMYEGLHSSDMSNGHR